MSPHPLCTKQPAASMFQIYGYKAIRGEGEVHYGTDIDGDIIISVWFISYTPAATIVR